MKQNDLFDIVFDKLKKISNPIILILTMLIWQAIGIIILKIFGINFNDLSTILKTIVLFACDLGFISLLGFIYRKDIFRDFKNYFNKNVMENLNISFKYWVIGLVIMVITNYIIMVITNGTLAENEQAVREMIDKVPIYMAFQVMIYAPFVEEVIFRKSISDATNNKIIFIIMSGLVFGGLHVISSVSSAIDLIYLVPYCSLGFVLAALYKKTNNIFSSIMAHSFHNTLALILYFIR